MADVVKKITVHKFYSMCNGGASINNITCIQIKQASNIKQFRACYQLLKVFAYLAKQAKHSQK